MYIIYTYTSKSMCSQLLIYLITIYSTTTCMACVHHICWERNCASCNLYMLFTHLPYTLFLSETCLNILHFRKITYALLRILYICMYIQVFVPVYFLYIHSISYKYIYNLINSYIAVGLSTRYGIRTSFSVCWSCNYRNKVERIITGFMHNVQCNSLLLFGVADPDITMCTGIHICNMVDKGACLIALI